MTHDHQVQSNCSSLQCMSHLTSFTEMKNLNERLSTNLVPAYFGVHDICDIEVPHEDFLIASTQFDIHCNDDEVKAILESIGCSSKTLHSVINAVHSSSRSHNPTTSKSTCHLSEPLSIKHHINPTTPPNPSYENILKQDNLTCRNATCSEFGSPTLCQTPTPSLIDVTNSNQRDDSQQYSPNTRNKPRRIKRITFQLFNCCFCSIEAH